MKVLSDDNERLLLELITENQIIMNSYDNLELADKLRVYAQFCANTSEALYLIGGPSAVTKALDRAFVKSNDDIAL